MNKLIAIGWRGVKTCYLNVTREEAIRRYTESDGNEPNDDLIEEIEFEDQFEAYDVWL